MLEFIPEHTPVGLDAFTTGYLEAQEWLLDDETDRSKIHGFSRAAAKAAETDCRDFQRANAADLALYSEAIGRDMASAGHDFFLTRNGHGAGFWSRGSHDCLTRLTDAACGYGGTCEDVVRGWIVVY